jgi:hypothetical protein
MLQDNEYKLFLNEALQKKHTASGMVFMKSCYSVILVILVFIFFLGSLSADAAGVNYDTAWTFVYDGGVLANNKGPINDVFYDVISYDRNSIFITGITADSVNSTGIFLAKFNNVGKMEWQTRYFKGSAGYSIDKTKDNSLIIGGRRGVGPFIMKLDTSGVIKWGTWYFDSLANKNILYQDAVINCVKETSNGNFICAAGDEYPENFGLEFSNYAAVLKFDSDGKILRRLQWRNPSGYKIGGFYIEQTATQNYLLSGNQALYYIDTSGGVVWQKNYTYTLEGVGSTVNNIARAKILRDGTLLVAGQAYEGNCWTKYKTLYYDAWWTPISYAYGTASAWDTLGRQGGDDIIYDFTQLVNGNIVFVGSKSSIGDVGGVMSGTVVVR